MSDEVVQIPDQRTVWGEEIFRLEGKATYYLSLRDGINFGLKKHIRMISSCALFRGSQVPQIFFKSGTQRTVGLKDLRNIEQPLSVMAGLSNKVPLQQPQKRLFRINSLSLKTGRFNSSQKTRTNHSTDILPCRRKHKKNKDLRQKNSEHQLLQNFTSGESIQEDENYHTHCDCGGDGLL